MGRFAEAERLFERALMLSRRMAAPPWQARTQVRWAEVLIRHDAPGDRGRAVELLAASRAIAERLGMVLLLEEIAQTETCLQALPERSPAEERRSPDVRRAPSDATFRCEGDYWTIAFGGETARVKHSIGLAHIARLLASPGVELHVSELIDLARSPTGQAEVETRPLPDVAARDQGVGSEPTLGLGDAGEVLDARARAAYRRRLRDLGEEAEEARSFNDLGRASRAAAEMEFLMRELAGGSGIGPHGRRARSSSERARVTVKKAIDYALARVDEHLPILADHLRRAIKTGTFCSYTPEVRNPVRFSL
jgi:hypothetical protein